MQELHRFMMHCLGADKHDQLVGYGVTVDAMPPVVILFMRFTETHQRIIGMSGSWGPGGLSTIRPHLLRALELIRAWGGSDPLFAQKGQSPVVRTRQLLLDGRSAHYA